MDTWSASPSTAELLRHTSWMFRLARALAPDDATADDLLQDTWVTLARRPPGQVKAIRPYLTGVVRNLARQRRRAETIRACSEQRASLPGTAPSPAELMERLELHRTVLELLKELPEPQRDTILLRYVKGTSAAEIARQQGIPAGTVRSRIKRGLDQLRRGLDDRCDGRRSAWCATLSSILSQDAGPKAATGGLQVLAGLLAMNGAQKLALAAAAVVVAMLGHWTLRNPGDPSSPPVAPSGGDTLLATLESPEGSPDSPGASTASREVARATSTVGAPSGDESLTDEVVPLTACLEARVVDERGLGLAGARVTVNPIDPGALQARTGGCEGISRAGGEVSIIIELGASSQRASLTATHLDRATTRLEARLDAGETTHLGDIVLLPFGAMAGTVMDQDGRAVEGARVIVCKPDDPPRNPDWLRFRGPGLRSPFSTGAWSDFSTRSGADGSFRVERVAVGSWHLWAGAESFWWSSLGPLEVSQGQDLTGLALVLERRQEEDSILGVVLSPEGEPVSRATLMSRARPPAGRTYWVARTDEEGRFEMQLAQRVPHDICAKDPEGRWSNVYAFSVMAGSRDLTLQFQSARLAAVTAEAEDGQSVQEFEVSVEYTDGQWVEHRAEQLDFRPTDGVARVLVPGREFRLEVDARGFALESLGPYAPDGVPDEIVARLSALPAVRGRVVAAGSPVAGAEVLPGRLLERTEFRAVDGFRNCYRWSYSSKTRTERDGSFSVAPREQGQLFLRVEHAGFAPSLVGPFEPDVEPDVEHGTGGLEIALGPGGAIEGRLIVPEGETAAGRIVGVSCGDGYPSSQRVDPDGRYRFEGLIPGMWQVVLSDRENLPDMSIMTASRPGATEPRPPIEWSCEVFEGRTTHHDLVVEDE